MKKSFIMVLVWILFSLGISGIAYSQVADDVNFKKTAVETQATITDVAVHPSNGRARVDATYTYMVEGQEYRFRGLNYPRELKENSTTTIYYSIQDPLQVRFINESSIHRAYFFIIVGLAFALFGLGMFFYLLYKALNEKSLSKLRDTGDMVIAQIDDVYISMSANGASLYGITCSYLNPVTKELSVFKRKDIMVNIKRIVEDCEITTISVYIDREKPARYFIDFKNLERYQFKGEDFEL